MELLADGEKTKIGEAIELMDDYGLDRDDLFETFDEFKVDAKIRGFSDLDSKQKSAFTREYN
jgi:replication factor C subunit 1